MKTPLAWLQLSHQKMRLLVAIIGVAFSNILVFTQFVTFSSGPEKKRSKTYSPGYA
jgi:hypothetical protein